MKSQHSVSGRTVGIAMIVLCGLSQCVIGADKPEKAAASPSPAEAQANAIKFAGPSDAHARYQAPAASSDLREAAKVYLRQILDETPCGSPNYCMAFTLLVKILQAEGKNDLIIQICTAQIGKAKEIQDLVTLTTTLADAYLSIKDRAKAEQTLEDLLDKCSAPDQFSIVWTKLTGLYQQAKESDRIVKLCAKQLGKELDPAVVLMITTTLSATYMEMGDYQNAAKVLDAFLEKNRVQIAPASVALQTRVLATICVTNLGLAKEAVGIINRELKHMTATNSIPQQVDLTLAKADIEQAVLKDLPAAIADYTRAIEMGGQLVEDQYAYTPIKLAQAYKDMGQGDQAIQVLMDVLKRCGPVRSPLVVQKLIEFNVTEQRAMEAVWLLRGKIAAQAAATNAVDQFEGDIIRLLVKAGKYQEALQEGRVFLYTCSDKMMPGAVELVAWILKSADLNLGRANTFLNYQKYGAGGEDGKPGTDDDLVNVLRDLPPISDAQRVKLFDATLAALPQDWQGYEQRGDIYLYLDQPVEAFQAYRKTFELCPMNEKDLQTATDAITHFVVRMTRDVPLAEGLVQYTLLGPVGKDRKMDTPDDLKDPMPDIIKRIQYNPQQHAAAEAASRSSKSSRSAAEKATAEPPAQPVAATPADGEKPAKEIKE